MALFRSDTGTVFGGVEEAAFGTESSNFGQWWQAKALPDRSNLKQMYHEADIIRSGNHVLPGVLGHKSDSSISVESYLRGYKAGSAPTTHPTLASPLLSGVGNELMEVVALAHAIGQISVSGGGATFSTVQAAPAPSTTAFTVGAGDGVDYAVGQDIMVDVSATATANYEVRRIKSISTDAITLEFPLSAAPAAGKSVFTGITIFPTQQPQVDSLSMRIQGDDFDGVSYWYHQILGARASALSMKWDARGFIEANFDFDVANWSREDAGAAPLYAADTGPVRVPLLGAKFQYSVSGGAPVCMDAASMEFDVGLNTLRPVTACGDNEGVLDSRFGISTPVMTVDPYKETEAEWMSAAGPFRSTTGVNFNFLAGSGPGTAVAFSISNGHLTDDPVLGDRDGLLINPLTVTPMVYTGDGTPGTDERNNTTPIGAPWTITIF